MINSIDLQTVLPRTIEAADLQGREINQQQHAAAQTAVAFQDEQAQEARQTNEIRETDANDYDLDKSPQGNGNGNSSENKKKKKKDDGPMAPKSDSIFDIMI